MFLRFFCALFFLTIVACEEAPQQPPVEEIEEKPPALILTKMDFSVLPGWAEDDLTPVALPFARSCGRVLKREPSDTALKGRPEFGSISQWQEICRNFAALPRKDDESLRGFFTEDFTPYLASADDEPMGLFTGYYEASLKGSRTKTQHYNIPLHSRPDDLVMVQLGDFREDLKGRRIAGRVESGLLRPYESREDIVAGDWPHEDEVLLWVDDPVDAFFVQIQGSGLVEMNDNTLMRIGYAGQNGHPYYAIGRELIKIGALTKENVSMQSIRAWLEANPDQADRIMNTNRSYVFFRELSSSQGGDGPIGGQGVALTAERSLAVDHSLYPYGIPVWVDLVAPTEGETPIQRLMVAQDTGGAIRGPVRGDVFWGYGDRAEQMAGGMKSKGQKWVLLPKQ